MINITRHPDKIMAAVSAPTSEYFMVVDIKTGKPQHFSINHFRKEALGEFMDADAKEGLPAGVFDRATALYLLGQSAVSAYIDAEESFGSGGGDILDFMEYNTGFVLIPVAGSCLPIPSSLNEENENKND